MRVLCDKTALPDLGALEAELAHEKNKKRCKGAFHGARALNLTPS